MKKFLHLGIFIEDGGAPGRDAIQTVLNSAEDWFRYAPNCWILYTDIAPATWYQRLAAIPNMPDTTSYLICEINIKNRSGWIREKAWTWINQTR